MKAKGWNNVVLVKDKYYKVVPKLTGWQKIKKTSGKLLLPVKGGIMIGKRFFFKPAWRIIREFLGPLLFLGIGAVIVFSCTGLFPPGEALCWSLGLVGVVWLFIVATALLLVGIFAGAGTLLRLPVILTEAAATPFVR